MRSAAKHRSNSVARSTPTRSAARDTPKKNKIHLIKSYFLFLY
ncbi:MAG: hypothetical protein NZ455_14540 [Bacteroidia bacterium]|nr:hypothetical protein [Bacteroidia bacterium]MDW8347509.1 hypothetical protein [Bacteroidia bacterium]